MNPHDADPAFSIPVLDQWHAKASSSAGEFGEVRFARSGPILSNVRAMGNLSGEIEGLARALY
jgi:hypothetical protein